VPTAQSERRDAEGLRSLADAYDFLHHIDIFRVILI
jgi:hypothetical protein